MPKDRSSIYYIPQTPSQIVDQSLVAASLLIQDMAHARLMRIWPLEDLQESVEKCQRRLKLIQTELSKMIKAGNIPPGDQN
jgi:hypothetical protein